MVLKETAEKILARLTEKSKDAAVIVKKTQTTMIKYANSQPSVVQNWINTTMHLYINREGRVFTTSISSLNPEDGVKRLLKLTDNYRFMEPSFYSAPLPEPVAPHMSVSVVDKKIEDAMLNPERIMGIPYMYMEEYGIERFAGMMELGLEEEALMTSKGFFGEKKLSYMKGYIRGFRGENSGQWSYTTTGYDEKIIQETVKKAFEYASQRLPKRKVEPGEKTVILSPMILSNLTDYIADASTATALDMGLSFLAKYKKGDQVGSESFTLLDSPLYEQMPYTSRFDDEGMPTKNKPIFKNGSLKNILHNTKTAEKRGEKSTGNAGWISPHPWNLIVQPGDSSQEEMIAETRDGLLITNNWYTRLQNYIEGAFSTVSRDAVFIIENGEPVGIAHRIRLADSFPRVLRNISLLGRTQYQIQWWEVETPVKAPYAMIEKARITVPE